MASIIQIGEKWRAQVRRKHHKPHTRTFRTRKEAQEWARQIESRIDAGVGPKTSALIKVGRSLSELLTQRLPLAKSGRHRITGPLYDAVDLFSCDRPIWPLHVAQSKAFPAPVWDAGCKRMRDLLTRVVGLFAWATIFCISARVARPCSEWCSNRSMICFRA